MVLQNCTTLTKVTEQWKKSQLVNQWKTICNIDTQRKNFIFKKQKDEKVITVTYKAEYYEKLEERFNDLPTNANDIKDSKLKSFARNVIEQKR